MYGLYARRDEFSSLTITLIYAAYAAGVIASLFLAGHLSDHLGRRPFLFIALGLDVVSAVVFIASPGLAGLFTVRVLCGLAVGITASTATAYLSELYAAHRPRKLIYRAQLLISTVTPGGRGTGALVVGLLAQYVPHPLTVLYLVMLAVHGRRIFYREAGPAGAPAVVLLHGFPTSSFMFRNLIPQLAESYHVIAPDHLGYGLSDAPAAEEFGYTFDALAGLTAGLLEQLGLTHYVIYVQDYGAPIGWRLALRDREAVSAVITQNGNGYDEGFVASSWEPIWAYQREQTPETEAVVRSILILDAIRFQYVTGVADQTLVSPDTWHHDYALLSRPGNDRVQLSLFRDYAANPPLYPALHDWLRERQVPVLAVWGKNDRSSDRTGRAPSPGTPPGQRPTSWTAATSFSKAPETKLPA